jgi:hypothetical protein
MKKNIYPKTTTPSSSATGCVLSITRYTTCGIVATLHMVNYLVESAALMMQYLLRYDAHC